MVGLKINDIKQKPLKNGARFHMLKGPLAENCDTDTSKNNSGMPTSIINIANGNRNAPEIFRQR
jgi:hypothetical protein